MAGKNFKDALIREARKQVDAISPQQVHEKIKNNEDFFIIDVREFWEWGICRMPKALHIMRGAIEYKIEDCIDKLDSNIVVYCNLGARSSLSAANLKKIGYTNVSVMPGGMYQWMYEGFPVDNSAVATFELSAGDKEFFASLKRCSKQGLEGEDRVQYEKYAREFL